FAILRLKGVKWDVEPWTPVDSILWGKMVTMSLTGNLSHDARRLNLLRFIGRSKREEWYAPYRSDMPVTVTSDELNAFRQDMGIPDDFPPESANDVIVGGGEGAGTNVWTLSPDVTLGGQALLVSDMHLAVRMPSIWHEIGLHVVPEPGSSEDALDIRGYMFTGIPGVASGQNDRIAWGQSNLYGDVQDYFIERIHPDDPDLYLVGDEWVRMDIVQEEIRVEGEDEPVIHQVRRTRHGPVMTDLENYAALGAYSYDEGDLGVSELAMSWPALTPGTLLESIHRINRAGDFEEFREALSYWDAPSINFVYADADGNIGYQAAGRHPERPAWQGQIPVPGWDDTYEVPGYIPFDQLPAAFNPSKGFLVSCNNALVYGEYPYYIGKEFSNGFRARRISEIIEGRSQGLSIDDITSVMMDTYSLQADETMRYFESIKTEAAYQAWLIRLESWEEDPEELEGKELRKKEKEEAEELEFLVEARHELDEWDRYVDIE
ncbi:MAG: penicillin acylase family protein, partial [Spirochaetaceae bacterium]|nr:penicillin acylase family protein [Spirochaetaceae bacterium]